MNKYDTVIHAVFENRVEERRPKEEVTFTREDINRAMDETGVGVKSPPDIPYAYHTSRDLPAAIAGHGFTGVRLEDESETDKNAYKFMR